jgi:hypothetical protein
MATILAHNGKTRRFDELLDHATDIVDTIASTGGCDPTIEGIFCYLKQTLQISRDFAHGDGNRRVRVPTIIDSGKVESDNISLVENPGTRYAMDYFIVYRRTERFGVTMVA